jgi:hypothetical protein
VEQPRAQIVDLMEALKASLAGKAAAKAAASKPAPAAARKTSRAADARSSRPLARAAGGSRSRR